VDVAALRCLYGYLPATLRVMAAAAAEHQHRRSRPAGQQRA